MEAEKITKWRDFQEYVNDISQKRLSLYWRGQQDPEWPLASKFEREILNYGVSILDKNPNMIYPYDGRYMREEGKLWADGFIQKMRDRHRGLYEKAACGLRGDNPAKLTPDQWWILGRHYHLVTPFLDWTEKPYIAAFFALTGMLSLTTKTEYGEIKNYLDKETTVYSLFHNEDLTALEGEGLRVVKTQVEELGRMQQQHGLFTFLDSEEFFELEGFLTHYKKEQLLTKVILSGQVVMEGLRDLEAHGISYRSLFPDLIGAANYVNYYFDDFPYVGG